jgi:hypothetical protein
MMRELVKREKRNTDIDSSVYDMLDMVSNFYTRW